MLIVAKFGDLAAGVQDCGVVAATEGIANLWQAVSGELFAQRHGDLPGPGYCLPTALRDQIVTSDAIEVRDLLLNILDGDDFVVRAEHVAQGHASEVDGDGVARHDVVRLERFQRGLELTHM